MPGSRQQMDYVLFFTVIILASVGVLTVYSASTVVAIHQGLAADHYALRQLVFAFLGVVGMGLLSLVPHRAWYRFAPLIMVVNFGLLVLVLLVGHSSLGGRRWIGTSSFYIQPSELAIIAVCIYLAFFFTKKVTVLRDFKRGIRPAFLIVGLNFALIFIEPDMGTGLSLLAVGLVLIFISGIPLRPLLIMLGIAIPALVGLAMSASYRSSRMLAFFHPFAHNSNAAYQLLQGWTAMAAGGWFGRGYDMSIAKTGYLPFPQTDFIFPVFVEEWGYVGGVALLATFGVLIWRGFSIARHSSDRFGALLAVGITSMITVKSIINLGAVSGLMPVTGIPLPFISYGGTSLIVNLLAMGILLSISKATLDVEPSEDVLADVVDVEPVLKQRQRERPQTVISLGQPKPKRTARVQSLSDKRKEASNSSSWRARQEAASTLRTADKGTKTRSRRGTEQSVHKADTWRARTERAALDRKGAAGSKSRKSTGGKHKQR